MEIEELVRDDLKRGRLVQPLELGRPSSRSFHLIWPETGVCNPKLRAFMQWIENEIAASR